MKKITSLLLLILFSLINKYDAWGQFQFQGVYGGTGLDYFYSVVQNSDGTFSAAGSTSTSGFGPGSDNVYLLKLAVDGSLLWNKTYGGTGFDRGNCVIALTDGWLLSGYTSSFSSNSDGFIAKVNSAGSTQWYKTFGSTGSGEQIVSVIQTTDGGFAGCGYTPGVAGTINGVLLVKTDANGSTQWSKIYGGTSGFSVITPYDLTRTADGGFIVVGGNNRWTQGSNDFTIIKASSAGTLQWTKVYGGSNVDELFSVRQTTDGGFIAGGRTASYGGGEDGALLKLSSAGAIQWSKRYGGTGTDQIKSVLQTTDGGYLASGNIAGTGAGNYDAFLMQVDNAGVVQWFKAYGGTDWEYGGYGQSLKITSDGRILYAGYSGSNGSGSYDGHLIVASATGTVGCNELTATPAENTISPVSTAASPTTASGWTDVSQTPAEMNPATVPTMWCQTPLAVRFSELSGKESKGAVILQWSAISEVNNNYFTIERAALPDFLFGEDLKWEAIGQVKGAGNSNVTNDYQFTDNSLPFSEGHGIVLYYRLKQVDFDGKFAYSDIITITPGHLNTLISIQPNPAKESLQFTINPEWQEKNRNKEMGISIYDVLGREVSISKFLIINSPFLIDINSLSKGMYLLQLKSETSHIQSRFLKD